MDFLFDLAAEGPAGVEVVGTMTRPIGVSRAKGMDLLGVRFRPGAIGAFGAFGFQRPPRLVTRQPQTLMKLFDFLTACCIAWGAV